MIQTKQTYEAPEAVTLVVRFEGALLTVSGDMEAKSWTTGQTNWFDDED